MYEIASEISKVIFENPRFEEDTIVSTMYVMEGGKEKEKRKRERKIGEGSAGLEKVE